MSLDLVVNLLLDSEAPDTEERCKNKHDDALLERATDPLVLIRAHGGALGDAGSDEDEGPHQERDESATGHKFADSALGESVLVELVVSFLSLTTFVALAMLEVLGGKFVLSFGVVLLLVHEEFFVVIIRASQMTVVVAIFLRRGSSVVITVRRSVVLVALGRAAMFVTMGRSMVFVTLTTVVAFASEVPLTVASVATVFLAVVAFKHLVDVRREEQMNAGAHHKDERN